MTSSPARPARPARWRPPMLVQAPADPIRVRPIRVDARTTPARLTWRVMTGARRYTVPSALLSVVHQVGEALVPVIMGLAIERAVGTGDVRELIGWLALLAANFAMLSFSWRFGSRIGELGMLAIQHELRDLVAGHLLRPAPDDGGSRPRRRMADSPGVALSLATSDVGRLSHAVGIGIYPVGQLAAITAGGAVLLLLSWPLGLAVLLGAPVLLWLTDRAGRPLRRRSGEEQAAAAEAAGTAADLMAGYRVVRGVGAEVEAAHRYRSASQHALASTLGARRAEGVFGGAMDLATGLFLTAIAVAAGLSAMAGRLSVGELITVVGLTQFLVAPLQGVAKNAGSTWASATASAERLLALLRDEPVGAPRPHPLDDDAVAGGGAADDLSVAALVAALGEGEVLALAVEGTHADAVLTALRRTHPDALVAPHAGHLFAGTVLDNVALPGISPQRVAEALLAAGCDELAETLPHGYATTIGEHGAALSGGQRQRVALARALAQDAPLLVLHDPTTAVDAVTEAAIAGRVRAMRGTHRTVVLTRSPALLAIADRVVEHSPQLAGSASEEIL